MTTNRQVIFHLSLIPSIGPGAIKRIVDAFGPDLDTNGTELSVIYSYTLFDFCSLGLTSRGAAVVLEGLQSTVLLEQEISLLERHQINVSTILDGDYPALLKNIYLPPAVLYWQGRAFNDAATRLAIVGSRKANNYSADVIELLLPSLVASGIEIVSGGALGVDTMSHSATVRCGGHTQVVLGSGLLHWYPYENERLFNQVLDHGGTMVSAFPLLMVPDRGNFPARNRIIAGLSDGCLILQAPSKSGALITAQFALEQGRQVFAVPGLIYDELSYGCHSLIQQGAQLVTSPADIALGLGMELLETIADEVVVIEPAKPSRTEGRPAVIKADGKKPEKADVKKPEVKAVVEDPLLALLDQPQALDDLVLLSGSEPDVLYDQLFVLQLQGKVRQTFTGQWVRGSV